MKRSDDGVELLIFQSDFVSCLFIFKNIHIQSVSEKSEKNMLIKQMTKIVNIIVQ